VSRYKTTVMVLVAAVMLLAANAPAGAETVAGKARQEIGAEVARKSTLPTWWRRFTTRLKSRYAMAAN
jgi:hypothetical protein